MLVKAALWAWSNKRLILILLALGTLYGVGRYHGASSVKQRWEAALIEESRKAEEIRARIQADADAKSAAYEKDAARRRREIAAINRRLTDEIAHNSALGDCVADASFVQIYGAAASDSGEPAP